MKKNPHIIKESKIKILNDLKADYQDNYAMSILDMSKAILIEIDKKVNKKSK